MRVGVESSGETVAVAARVVSVRAARLVVVPVSDPDMDEEEDERDDVDASKESKPAWSVLRL